MTWWKGREADSAIGNELGVAQSQISPVSDIKDLDFQPKIRDLTDLWTCCKMRTPSSTFLGSGKTRERAEAIETRSSDRRLPRILFARENWERQSRKQKSGGGCRNNSELRSLPCFAPHGGEEEKGDMDIAFILLCRIYQANRIRTSTQQCNQQRGYHLMTLNFGGAIHTTRHNISAGARKERRERVNI